MRYACSKYFVDIQVLNAENIPSDKPVLLLPNHRSAFMDPIIVGTQIKRTSHFLARGEQFGNKIMDKIYARFKMIPIYRKEHTPGKTKNNIEIFKHCYELMKNNGCLMVFPEGLCQTKHILSPLKTGSAKIALESEALYGFKLGVQLIPIGINYTNPHRFRGKVVLNVGEPILAQYYQLAYEKDNWKGIQQLTDDVEEELKSRILVLENPDDIETVHNVEKLVKSSESLRSDLDENWYKRRSFIGNRLEQLKKKDAPKFSKLSNSLNRYFFKLNNIGIAKLSNTFARPGLISVQNFWLKTLLLILSLPFFVVGLILHYIPFALTRFISLKSVKRVDFMGSFSFALGLLLFGIAFMIQARLLFNATNNYWILVIFFFVWPGLGLYTYGYFSELVKWINSIKWFRFGLLSRKSRKKLEEERGALITQLQVIFSK